MIERRELSVNDKLPFRAGAGGRYGVSRITVRQAIQELEKSRLLADAARKGHLRHSARAVYELEVVRSFTQTAMQTMRKPGMRLLKAEIRPGRTGGRKTAFRLPTGAEVVLSERLRLLDDLPVVVQRDWFSASLSADILDID